MQTRKNSEYGEFSCSAMIKVFLMLHCKLENKNELCFDEKCLKTTTTAYIPYNEQQNGWLSTLCSLKGPSELLHADISDIRFLAILVVDPNTVYSLLICSPLRFTGIQRKIEDFWKKLSNSITKLIKKEYKWRDENTNRSRIQIKQNKKPKQRIQCKDCQHKFWRW